MKSTRYEEATKGDTASMGDKSSELDCNGLLYRIPQPLSSTISRSFKREYSQKNVYNANQVIVFDLNTGTTYINPASAMLSFKFNITKVADAAAATIYKWDGALGYSLFTECRIISKNGVELSRTQDCNQLSKIMIDYMTTTDYKKQLQMATGYSGLDGVVPPGGVPAIVPYYESTVAAAGTSFANDLQILLPMRLLSSFFRPIIDDMLIPAGLASGLRIELTLVPSAANAMNSTGPGGAGATANTIPSQFTVTDPTILVECSELDSVTQNALAVESANNGLEYSYPEYYSTKINIAGGQTISTQVNKAVSQGTRLFVTVQPVVPDLLNEMKVDSLASGPTSMIKSYQFRVGSMYFPNLLVDNNIEKFGYALSAMSSLYDYNVGNGISFYEYTYGGKNLIAASLETNSRLNLSGLMLNNSSVAEVRLTNGYLPDGVATAIRGVLYLEYVAVARTSLNRTQLRI